jgi:tetratricopeptide (TPR) repeat protein
MSEARKWLAYSKEKSTELHEVIIMALMAEAQQLSGDTEGARRSLSQASEILDRQPTLVMPGWVAPFAASRLFITVEQMKSSIRSKHYSNVAYINQQAYKAGKSAVRISRKYAPYRTKILRLMGLYYWLIGKQGKALKWWDKAIQEGERLCARPDLSRTYFEVGKRLLEPEIKYKQLNGIDAKGYLDKARKMFEEMGLERDLDELDKITS